MHTPLNVVYIHSHDTGRYISPYGHAMPTPNYQRFAEQSLLFRKAFCAGPTCSPSRAGLLTGQWAHSAGMIGLAHLGFRLRAHSEHLAAFLSRNGYETVLGGVQHVCKDNEWQLCGYTHSTKAADQFRNAETAAEYILSNPRKPFFLDIGFIETHREFFTAGSEDAPRYCLPPPPLPDTPQTRQDMAEYKATVRVLDRKVGTVLNAIDRSAFADNTLVILTTDHGIAFPEMKCNLTDHGIGVLLMLRGPGGFSGGKVSDALVSQIDLFPTICELAGLEKPNWLQGTSLCPLARGEREEVRDEIFSEVTYHASYEPKRCVRTQRFKYIRRFDGRRMPVMPNCDDGYSKQFWLQNGWSKRVVAQEELFDLVFDPMEAANQAANPEYSTALSEMRGRLDRWMKETDDPLLKGPVKAPKGARYDDVNALHHGERIIIAE